MSEEELLRRGANLPSLELPEAGGTLVRSADFRGRCNLILFISHPPGCDRCDTLLRELAAGYEGLVAAEAEVLAIVPGPPPEVAFRQLALGVPFPVLVDAGGEVARLFGGAPALAVVDRFGEIFKLVRGGGTHQLLSVQQIAEWVDFIGLQCPE